MTDNLKNIMALQAQILTLPQAECEILHHHVPGVYCREMRAAAGTLIVGKMHKTEHLNILSKGAVAVATPEGEPVVYEAPCMIHSQPGTKRVLLALTDIVWTNIHANPTDERDEEKVEQLFVVEPGLELEYARLLLEEA